MTFKERLFNYTSQSFSLTDKIALASFAVLRNHPLHPTSFWHRMKPFIHLKMAAFKGKRIVLNTANFSHFIIADEFIYNPIYDLSRIKFQPEIIMDCGAHIGLFTVLAASNFPDAPIISFEPLPENIAMFKRQVALNRFSNVKLEEAAVSTKDGDTTFHIADASFGGSLQETTVQGQQQNLLPVKIKDLKTYIKKYPNKKLLLKMDIEGEEENIFPDVLSLLPAVCAIFFETHSENGKINIHNMLRANGFNVEEIRTVDQYADHFASRG
jgi:FkbM family methyltransferase